MCIKSYEHFTKCDHVSTTLTPCPTYRKQQKSAEGPFGRLFQRSDRKKTNCGRVFPHHLQNNTYCQACLIKTDHFTAEGVGQGALRVRKQGFQEVFQEERKEAARASLHNSEKPRLRQKGSNHNVIHVESTVWIDDLYHHPEILARKESYARAAGPAPPVSSRAAGTRQRRGENTRKPEIGEEWMPAYGGSQPIPRPAQPAPTYYQYPGRVASHSPSLPPAVGPPPGPRQGDYSLLTPRPQAKRPELKHKRGQVYNSAKIRNQRLSPPYKAYLDGMATEAAIRARQRPSAEPPRGPDGPKSCWEEEPSQWEAKKATLSSWIERTKGRTALTDGSDVSFVCQTSQAISNQVSDQSRSKRVRRGSRM
ncbi:hypothetical protein F5B18DRAFT_502993 [Nemania serpens]|nr:hypothetical protein F5B18DRAFT_502993 [Nemania serpens]